MKKRFFTVLLVVMTSFSLVACGNKEDVKDSTNDIVIESETIIETESNSEDSNEQESISSETENVSPVLDENISIVFEKVKTTLGEDYIPGMEIPIEILEGTYGITSDMYESVYGEMPMMSAHIDFLIGVKAKSEMVDTVASTLQTYVTNLQNDTMQYPSNLAKLPATEVITIGDYVFVIGTFGGLNLPVDSIEEDVLAYAKNTVATTKNIIEEILAQ